MPKDATKMRWFEQHIMAGVFTDLYKSPLSFADGPVGPGGPRLPDPFPPKNWMRDIGAMARGDKSSLVFKSAEEKQVKMDRKEFEGALGAKDPVERSVVLARTLNTQLGTRYNGKTTKRDKGVRQHPAEARIQRSAIALESLLAAGKGFKKPEERKALLLAINLLPPDQQVDLFRADELGGRKLYSALYLAMKDEPEKETDLKQSFAQVKGAAQLARVGTKLDQHDPSGETGALVNGLMRHLDQAGLTDQDQNAFADKLVFKLTLQKNQTGVPDIPLPDTSKPGWREKFTSRTLSTLAEVQSVTDESIEKALDMPEADLVKVMGNSYLGTEDVAPDFSPDMKRREGDMRLARVAKAKALNEGNTDLHALLDGLDSNYLDRKRMLEEAQKGKSVKEILQILEAEAEETAGKLAEKGGKKIAKRVEQAETNIKDLEERIKKAQEENASTDELEADLKFFKQAVVDLKAVKIPSREVTLQLIKRFGRFPLQFVTKYGEGPYKLTKADLPSTLGPFKQLEIHAKAVEDPLQLKQGLLKSSFVLPTAGKSLKHCPWLESTAADLVRVAIAIREKESDFTLKNHPIIILDQSDGDGKDAKKQALWDENGEVVKKLALAHQDVGLTIRHVSMKSINKMMKDSGVEKLFDTTGEGNAGYGGCRNMAFMLGPVIQQAIRDGEDPDTITADSLAGRIKKTATSKDAPKLLMGDDTDYVAPGTVAAKMALGASDEHKDEYSLMATYRYGRDTQGVSSLYTNGAVSNLQSGGMEGFTSWLFSSNKWNNKNTTPGMGCTYGEPRFCLDLPTGAEEKQCNGSTFTQDYFAQASHLSGDRQTSPSAFLKSFMSYGNMTETVKALFDVEKDLPWNAEAKRRGDSDEKPFGNVGEMMAQATDPAKSVKLQKKVLTNLVTWRGADGKGGGPLQLDGSQATAVQKYLDDNPSLDEETRDELVKVKEVYDDGQRQAALMKDFTDRLLKELKLSDKANANDLESALDEGLKDPGSIKTAIAKIRSDMAKEGGAFDKTSPMLRDLVLVLESLAGGGFGELCDKLK